MEVIEIESRYYYECKNIIDPRSTFGELINEEDESACYEYDESELYLKDGRYTCLSGAGCSCWDGNMSGWTDISKEELLTLATEWAKEREYPTAETSMGKWILENVVSVSEEKP